MFKGFGTFLLLARETIISYKSMCNYASISGLNSELGILGFSFPLAVQKHFTVLANLECSSSLANDEIR